MCKNPVFGAAAWRHAVRAGARAAHRSEPQTHPFERAINISPCHTRGTHHTPTNMARHSIRPVRLPLAVASGRATTGTPERPRRRPPSCMRPGSGTRRAPAAARGPARPPPAPHAPPARPPRRRARARYSSGPSARRAHLRARRARPRSVSGSKVMCLGVLRRLGDVDARLARPPVARRRRGAASRQRSRHRQLRRRPPKRDRCSTAQPPAKGEPPDGGAAQSSSSGRLGEVSASAGP